MKNNYLFNFGGLRLRTVFFGFLILCLVFIGIPFLTGRKTSVDEGETEAVLLPSDLLLDKKKYHLEKVVVRGRVSLSPVVCQEQDCPVEDLCCGCPEERDLLVVDPGSVLLSKTQDRLRLLSRDAQPLCQRETSGCQYDCGDWVDGGIYDLEGTFFFESPPPGWQMSLDQYFQVENKHLVGKTGWQEKLGTILEEIKKIFSRYFGKGRTYILD